MIQRIQSIFFLLSGICFGGEFATSFLATTPSVEGIFKDGLFNLSDHTSLQIISGLGVILSLAAIFLYAHRNNQIKVGYLIVVLSISLPLVAFVLFQSGAENVQLADVSLQPGIFLPLGILIFAILGIRSTKKDEKLVQSMDRLR